MHAPHAAPAGLKAASGFWTGGRGTSSAQQKKPHCFLRLAHVKKARPGFSGVLEASCLARHPHQQSGTGILRQSSSGLGSTTLLGSAGGTHALPLSTVHGFSSPSSTASLRSMMLSWQYHGFMVQGAQCHLP